MTCPYRDVLYRDGPEAVPEDHLATCADCAARVARLQAAKAVLRAQNVAADHHLPVRIRAAVRQRRRDDARQFNVRAISTSLVVLVATWLYVRRPPPPESPRAARAVETTDGAPTGRPPAAPSEAEVWTPQRDDERRYGDLKLTAVDNAARVSAASAQTVRIHQGRLNVVAAPPDATAPWRMITPTARIQLTEQARVSVQAGAQETVVIVEAGRVLVEPLRGTSAPRWLTVGHRWRIPGSADEAEPARAVKNRAHAVKNKARTPPAATVDRVAQADRHRRTGREKAALTIYRTVLTDNRAHRYDREYSALQGALLLQDQGRRTAALRMLLSSPGGWNAGALLPERVRIATQLYIELGRIDDAKALLKGLRGHEATSAVIEARLRLAQAIADRDRVEAKRLLEGIDLQRVDPGLARSVRDARRALIKKQ